jgi:hypothetical protein
MSRLLEPFIEKKNPNTFPSLPRPQTTSQRTPRIEVAEKRYKIINWEICWLKMTQRKTPDPGTTRALSIDFVRNESSRERDPPKLQMPS